MSFLKSKTFLGLGLAALVALAVIFNLPQTAAQAGGDQATAFQKGEVTLEPAVSRTFEQMEAAEQALGPKAPAMVEVPFRPTMPADQYAAAKALAAAAAMAEKAPLAPATPPVVKGNVNFSGDNNTGWAPPDTMGCAGTTQYIQVVNSRISIYKKPVPNTLLKRVSLNSFFGYSTQAFFDPQVIFDHFWKRWIVTAPAFPEGPGLPMYFAVAISKTANATGAWWIYFFNTRSFISGDFFDYPKVGYDLNSLLFTANNFVNNGGYIDSRFFTLAKTYVYNGLPVTFTYWYNFHTGTIIPPKVWDNNTHTYLLNAPAGGSTIYKLDLQGSGLSSQTLAVTGITVPAYVVPPDATQPGTTAVLDTLDARFIGYSHQMGSSIFNVHTVGTGPYPIPKFYEFNTATNAIVQSGYFFVAGTSNDWNATLAANSAKDVFFTWTSNNPPLGINAQVRFAGRQNTADLGSVGISPTILASSPTYLNGVRWGDYSNVSIDPSIATQLHAWVTNEWIGSTDMFAGWRSQIAHIGY